MDYELFQAWSVWVDGRLAPSDAVFGVPIFWWGRVGKVADFLAAILLLWDAGTSTWARAFSQWLRASRAWWSQPGDQPELAKPRGASFALHCFFYIGICVGSFLPLLWFDNHDPNLIAWIEWADATLLRRLTIELPIFLLLWGIGFVLTYGLLVFPLFWLTEAPRLPSRMRLVALCLLLLGVHFSLLAS